MCSNRYGVFVYGAMQKKIGSDISRAAYADNTRIAHPITRSTEQKAYYRDAFLRHPGNEETGRTRARTARTARPGAGRGPSELHTCTARRSNPRAF